jgi:hypothetical protein
VIEKWGPTGGWGLSGLEGGCEQASERESGREGLLDRGEGGLWLPLFHTRHECTVDCF